MLLERAVTAADLYTAGAERAGLRRGDRAACLDGVSAAPAGEPAAAGAGGGVRGERHSASELALVRLWLTGSRGRMAWGRCRLRGSLLRTLAARGFAADDDLDALVAADPVAGEQNRATCRALRPDARGQTAAWAAALADGQDWRMALASARGIWVPGQEELLGRSWLAEYRDRYFTEALPALDGREVNVMRYLARALYPATLAEPATLTATAAARGAAAGSATGCGWSCSSRRPSCVRCWRRDRLAAVALSYSSRAPRSAGTSTE